MTTFTPSLKTLQEMYEQECTIIHESKAEIHTLFSQDNDYSVNSDRIKALKTIIENGEQKKIKLINKMAEMQKDIPTSNLNQVKNEHFENAVKSLNEAREILEGPILEYIQSYTEQEVQDDFEKSLHAVNDAWYHLNYALRGADLSNYVLSKECFKLQHASPYGKTIEPKLIIENPTIEYESIDGPNHRILKTNTIDAIMEIFRQNPESNETSQK